MDKGNPPMMTFVPNGNVAFRLYDCGDRTYHAGDGRWTRDENAAETYGNTEAAFGALEDVDQGELLRDRLMVVACRPLN